jgi:hypothetical protein
MQALRPITLLACALLASAVPSAQTPSPAVRPWEVSVTVCGLSFRTMSEWVVVDQSERRDECGAALQSRNYDRLVGATRPLHFWRIAIQVVPKPMDEVLALHDVRRDGDRWFAGEVAGGAPAYEIRGSGWWGIRVDSLPIRSGAREGGSFESGAVWVAMTSATGRRTATLLAGDGSLDVALPLLLNSVRF